MSPQAIDREKHIRREITKQKLHVAGLRVIPRIWYLVKRKSKTANKAAKGYIPFFCASRRILKIKDI